jgi:hypothetical protein
MRRVADRSWHDIAVQSPSSMTSQRSRRVFSLGMLLLFLSLALTGCLRAQASFNINENDRVSGKIIAALLPRTPDDKGPQLKVPDSLSAKARVEPYESDGYVGSQLTFYDLSFAETRQLSQSASDAPGAYDLQLRRIGGKVELEGRIDLRNVPAEGADIKISFSFPASLESTNGNRDSSRSVSWMPAPGEVSLLRAEVEYTDPNTRSFAGWTGLVVGASIGIAILVGAMAWVNRDQSPKPGELESTRNT